MFKKNKQNKNDECGIMALFPAIIISGILLILCVSASRSFLAFLYRTTLFDEKVQSSIINESCTLRVLAKHIQNNNYAGEEAIYVEDTLCTVSH